MFKAIAIFCIQSIVCISGISQSVVDSLATEFMKRGQIPGMFLAVLKNDSVLIQRNYGFANVEDKKPVTETTCMELGSISKAFTGDLIHYLHYEKLLDVNDPVTKYFADAPLSWSGITINHLLEHTSGIQNYLLDPRFKAGDYFQNKYTPQSEQFFSGVTTDSLIRMFYTLPIEFAPGSSWSYSNTGYILLGKIAEKVTGESYFDAVQKRQLVPVGMHQTMQNDLAFKHGYLAKGYFFDDTVRREAKMLSGNYAFSAGAWATTGNDMVKYVKAIHQRNLPVDHRAYRWRAFKSFSKLPFTYRGGRFYTTFRGHQVIFHNGGTPGFSSSWIYNVDNNISVIVMINRQDYAPIDRLAWNIISFYEPKLQFPMHELTTAESVKIMEDVKGFLNAVRNNSKLPGSFSRSLKFFLESENGKGLWQWVFERGIPEQVFCTGRETNDGWKVFYFRLPYNKAIEYHLTFVLDDTDQVTQILWR
jgi:D-alanyl-D-alanine carboxypeptidase